MEQLPNEVIEIILSSRCLSYEDVLNFGTTCKHFHDLVRGSNYIWKNKYQQRHPKFIKLFDIHFCNWYAEILYMQDLHNRTHQLLSTMPTQFYKRDLLSEDELSEWLVLANERLQAHHYIVTDLLEILNDTTTIQSIEIVPVDMRGNKTLQYYSIRVLRFLRQKYLGKLWKEFERAPLKEQLLEQGATLVAQWCQPTHEFEFENIRQQLDDLATQVIAEVKVQFPNHPLLKIQKETLLQWRLNNLDSNQFDAVECRQIMTTIVTVMFVQNKFCGNSVSYYLPENSYINEVLHRKQGLPITLVVIFESVARRVGLKCEPYPFPSHFLLKFTEGNGENHAKSYYIDVFNGNIIRKGSCPFNNGPHGGSPHMNLDSATTREVVVRMANNLELSCRQYSPFVTNRNMLLTTLELIHLVNPDNLSTVTNLARLYMMHGIDTETVEAFLLSNFRSESRASDAQFVNLLHEFSLRRERKWMIGFNLAPAPKTDPKIRPKNLIYAVGMIVKHIGFNYHCIIYDWDATCKEPFDWQSQIGYQRLQFGQCQPFYKVLVGDGSHCYAPQELLTTTEPFEIHFLEEIGKHFSHFFQTHYVPNAEKEREYPGDAEVRHKFHQQTLFGS